MAATKLHVELQHLKYQLQPHFFFNALNNIYSLIVFDPDKAQKSVHSLSKLMRLRLTEKTIVTTDFPTEVLQVEIAPLLLITLVENAFKHGVSATTTTQIHFSIKSDEKMICFTAENTLLAKQNSDLYSSSIGIDNLRKQLNLIYPNRNAYTITTEGGKYKSEIVIQI
ncbi:hypothetical protein RCZ15_12420 [Capnocytophaga catalasegens]|uniref:Signal transduction histidine kinase internal region domain-containing protein n=2 Tax=Capnocytophaga catalasegens TaxID=1004260 RepID=A0AAV5AUJ4_9FLAO|nr:hypothetical protein RCZ03_24920 [Capnocytophaga catalasegens]GJM50269.1 hypothetical protein RCZ15_12420 [Capnocytophaga catalasegens]GJM53786.1 hypothetical protein RCZ16_21020 [Capnocytophaga catalasegens]